MPVNFSSQKWIRTNIKSTLPKGAHKSFNEHIDFINEEFTNMIKKRQWVILPAAMEIELEGLQFSPPVIVLKRDGCPW